MKERCACCGLAVNGLIEIAHIPDRSTAPDRVMPLCSLCHRAYDLELTTQAEIEVAEAAWQAGGEPPYRLDALIALWATRKPNWPRLQKGAQKRAGGTIRRRNAAKRAAATKKLNAASGTPGQETVD